VIFISADLTPSRMFIIVIYIYSFRFVYRKLRFCVRGFSAGKSDVTKLQLPLVKY
jgi:hypothetical protein